MRHAIFLRAVNVGGSGVAGVAAIAKKLGLKNIGAAGTFVSYGPSSAPALAKAVAKELGFDTTIMVVPRPEIRKLVEKDPFAKLDAKQHYVTVLAAKPKSAAALPKEAKGVRYLGIDGRFLLSAVLPDAKPGTTPLDVEKLLGVAGTARNWNTILKVAKALDEDPA
ncbi:MAG TPA: DUF1697 domain-containing protein [Candidatus Thermoplasmatota archaeon]|nr:DUF1697 domain-containing protein [Candidatus Thermoplasmatota archaeon]